MAQRGAAPVGWRSDLEGAAGRGTSRSAGATRTARRAAARVERRKWLEQHSVVQFSGEARVTWMGQRGAARVERLGQLVCLGEALSRWVVE
jgi:hypothetical protein